jgi:ribonucleoside-diphosphate reductase beta chain
MSQFALLLAYQQLGKFRGMSQINTYSIKDEFQHCVNNSKLFLTYVRENPDIYTDELKEDIRRAISQIVEQESAMTDYLYNTGSHPLVTRDEAKTFTELMADKALALLGLETIYNHTKNPLPFMDDILGNLELSNFFEVESTAYAKGAVEGSWSALRAKPSTIRKVKPV